MSDEHPDKIAKQPERRLLEAMVTLNAVNNGRSVPDMSHIRNGFIVGLAPSLTRAQKRRALIAALEKSGFTVNSSKTD